MLARIRIVLCSTTHPGNIGAAARAMKTMGLTRLALVNPRFFPDEQATALAAGADDVLAAAKVYASLVDALQGTILVVGMTARRRDLSHEMRPVREVAQRVADEVQQGDVALVFGTEMAGLSNAELDACQMLANIPAQPGFSSLNLAASVQIAAYELRQALLQDRGAVGRDYPLASHEEMESFYQHLERVLRGSGFLNPAQPGRLMIRLRRLFSRARMEREETSILRGILKALYPADDGSSRPF
ncbi:MAG: RNA methyltransferase [Betaproteobacteria bacterium]|nr:RNA methyltransferase [Betaproteobacteria bacterium]